MKATISILIVFGLTLSVLVACGGSPSATATPTQTQHYTVTMGGTTFDNNTITIPKGSSITFTTDPGGTHNLVVGTNGKAVPETGTPDFGTGGQAIPAGQSW